MHARAILSALAFSVVLPIPGLAQEAIPPLFASHETLELRIEANFNKIHKERKQNAKSYPAKLRVEGPDGTEQELELKIKTRGKFRLKKSTCPDPPLRLSFPKSKLEGTVFEGQDKLKLESAEQWMRTVETQMRDFLRTKFALEAAQDGGQ